ncbi:MAG: DUF2076 domain-containing protein [Bradyrhizobium sp.]|uniref:DUF2076 domain-containing protein n=1 Tax=Bradyrhizobium sp. TaxID=376 RepID=UPI001DAB61FF|nr:DUF2076 domain-containing protein [Bradyrhizobium sp.]MBV9565922.1 DUF2076 domain-containing protein [Bradyrhizobium sp.]
MTPQERQLVDDLFDRLAKLENAPRDPDADAAILQGLRKAPNAAYALVQTVLLQDEALKRANGRIQELEQQVQGQQTQGQSQSGGFLDSMRDAIFGSGGSNPSRGSVPNVPPPQQQSRPVWNSGQVLQGTQQGGYQGSPHDQGGYGQPPYGQGGYGGYGGQPYGTPAFGGGGSFLGTAAAAAAGVVGGSLLLGGIRSMMGGGHHQAFGDTTIINEPGSGRNPWSDQSGSSLANDLGANDVGLAADHADDSRRAGLFDQTSNDDDDRDDMDIDGDDFGGNGNDDGGSDYA